MKKKVIIPALIAIVLVAIVAFKIFSKPIAPEQVSITSVEVVKPSVQEVLNYTEQMGSVTKADSVSILPKVGGEVVAVNVKVGDRVSKGQVLASLSKENLTSLKIQVDTAAIAVNDANTALSRATELFNSGAISEQNLEQARSAASQANLAYKSAKTSYDQQNKNTNIISPIDGVVETKNIELHNMVSGTSPVFVVSSEGTMSVKFGVTEEVKNFISIGDTVNIEKDDENYTGNINSIDEIASTSGLYNVETSINETANISSGTKVKISLVKSKNTEDLTIPTSAIHHLAGEAYVYILDDGIATRKDVVTGIYDKDKIVVKSGLSENDEVIYTWSKELYDGANVVLADKEEKKEDEIIPYNANKKEAK